MQVFISSWLLLFPIRGECQFLSAHVPMIHRALEPANVVVVINENDPASIETGVYYQMRRGIPPQNVIRVRFSADASSLSIADFEKLFVEVQRRTPAKAQAYALAWTRPYRTGCLSITTAFAFGFDQAFCSTACGPTRVSPYFNSNSIKPWVDHRLRPAMLLAGRNTQEVLALIDRGIASDFTYPPGTAYLARTSDKARNVRASEFANTAEVIGNAFHVNLLDGVLQNRSDIMAYFTGLADVPGLDSLGFRPGAVADHLTSYGGQLTDSSQMSALAWLTAGATGSYGTVTEPCAHPQKFPHAGVFLQHYLDGDTLIEAYWKSVAWPGEGVFIGEPLARPFGARIRMGNDGWILEAHAITSTRHYLARTGNSAPAQARLIGTVSVRPGHNRIRLPVLNEALVLDPYMPKPRTGALVGPPPVR